jgi:hypothetical protein
MAKSHESGRAPAVDVAADAPAPAPAAPGNAALLGSLGSAPGHASLQAQQQRIDALLAPEGGSLAERWELLRGLVNPHFALEDAMIFPALDAGTPTEETQRAMATAAAEHPRIHAAAAEVRAAAAGTAAGAEVAAYVDGLGAHAAEEDAQFLAGRS